MMTKRYIKDALLGIFVVALWAAIGVMMLTTWAEHPAESVVNGYAYMESIGGGN